MVDYLFGMLLFAFGLGSRPAVLGEQSTGSATKSLAQLKLMRPKFSAEEQEKFQLERKKQEANIKRIGDVRIAELKTTYEEKKAARQEKDRVTKEVFVAKVAEFQDAQKKQRVMAIADKYQTTVTALVDAMQTKLQTMLVLLDRITAASGALKAQGEDVSHIETSVSSAGAKVSSAITAVNLLAETLPTALTISGEDGAKDDVLAAIATTKSQVQTARVSFAEAHSAVGKALSDLEQLTDAVQVGLWPER